MAFTGSPDRQPECLGEGEYTLLYSFGQTQYRSFQTLISDAVARH